MVKLAYTTLVTFHACHECHQNEVNSLKPIATEYQVAGWHQQTAEQRLTSREFRTPPDRDPRQRARGCGRSTRVSSGRPEGEISILDTSKFRPGLRSPGQAGRSRVPGPGRTSRPWQKIEMVPARGATSLLTVQLNSPPSPPPWVWVSNPDNPGLSHIPG